VGLHYFFGGKSRVAFPAVAAHYQHRRPQLPSVTPMHDLPKPGDLVGRKYKIIRPIGSGGMGVVYQAINVDTEGHVALKWLNPQLSSSAEATERFKREAKVTARIQHPNVVAVHDCGEHEGQLYLIMELLRGCSLRERLNKEPMVPESACRLLLPVMRGVAAAHAAGVLHRDLKPENIFLCELPDGLEPVPKVLDFGIAKLGYDADETALSAQSAVLGTYQYMAPEQLRRQRDLDARADIYAMGVVLYRMLTGAMPYDADNPVDLALQILQSEAPRLSQHISSAPSELEKAVARALARDRYERYPSMNEFAVALEPFTGGLRYRGSSHDVPKEGPAQPHNVRRARAQPTPFADTTAPLITQTHGRKWKLTVTAVALTALAGLGYKLWSKQTDARTTIESSAAAEQPSPTTPPSLDSKPSAAGEPAIKPVIAPSPDDHDEWQSDNANPVATAPETVNPSAPDAGLPRNQQRLCSSSAKQGINNFEETHVGRARLSHHARRFLKELVSSDSRTAQDSLQKWLSQIAEAILIR
jgi:eukaryotic-like serine/threonine-protein kinase